MRWQLEYEQFGKYTLNMVEIDNAIKNVITEIKAEERKIADRKMQSKMLPHKFLWLLK